MAEWAPNLVTPKAHTDLTATITSRKDVFCLAGMGFSLTSVVIRDVMEQAKTSDLGQWGFICVLLVFMRAMTTGPVGVFPPLMLFQVGKGMVLTLPPAINWWTGTPLAAALALKSMICIEQIMFLPRQQRLSVLSRSSRF